jgi:hypothetical protein
MLQFHNATGLAGTFFVAPDTEGIDSVFAVLKGTFALDRGLAPAEEQLPPVMAAVYHEDPVTSSIRVASDASLVKPATDVLLVGSAWAPGELPTTWTDVSLVVGPVAKTVRVFGDRVWDAGAAGAVPSPPTPFVRMPLAWERAFGGTDVTEKGPTAEPRNPVGLGFRAAGGQKPLDGMPLPNLEDPSAPISSWRDRPPPACFAPVAPHWQPRLAYAGTYDEQWQQARAPYLPTDFDARFFQCAPPGLVCPGYLQGGEPVDIRGASPGGVLSFRLPAIRVQVTFVVDGRSEIRSANLDTVLIEPDAGRVSLVWRAVLACDKKVLRVNEIRPELQWAS